MTAAPAPRPVARLTTPAQMVASLPHWLGFVPTESLVVACCHEPRGRLGLTMRLDLPQPQHEAALVQDLVRRVRKERATRVLLAVWTEQPDPGPGRAGWAGASLVDELRAELADLVVTEAVLVRGGRFWSYLCSDPRCCPPEGTPVDEAEDSDPLMLLRAERVLEGRALLPDRAALEAATAGPVFLAAEAARQRCERAADLLLQEADSEGHGFTALMAVSAWLDAIERAEGGQLDTLTDDEAARLAVSLTDPSIRDVLVASDPDDLPPLLQVLEELCRRTPAPFDAPVCAVYAWLCYCRGGGAVVSIAVERALRSDPHCLMAQLIDEALAMQLPPSELRRISAGVSSGTARPATPRR